MPSPLRHIALRNVRLHWRQSLAALASISAGFISLSLFQGYMTGIGGTYEEVYAQRGMLGQILIEKAGAQNVGVDEAFRFSLPPEDQKLIDEFLGARTDRIAERVRFLQVSGMVSSGKANAIFGGFGYDVSAGAQMRKPIWEWNTLAGVPLDRQSAEDALGVGQGLGQILGCRAVGSPRYLSGTGGYIPAERPFQCDTDRVQVSVTTFSGQLNAIDAPIVGILDGVFKEVDTKYLVMSLETAQKLLNTQSVSWYSISLKSRRDVKPFITELRDFAREKGLSLDVTRWQDHKVGDLYVRSIDFLGLFRNFVVAVILAIVLLSIFNTLLKIITERTREIGMLRSLGFRSRQVITLFVMEASFLASLGSTVGLLATLLLSAGVNALGVTYKAGMLSEPIPFRIAFDGRVYLLSFVCLFSIAVGTAFFSVLGVAKRRISDSLGHV